MHAIRGTIGHDPIATAKAEGRDGTDLFPITDEQARRDAKQASRDRWFRQAQAVGTESYLPPIAPSVGALEALVTAAKR